MTESNRKTKERYVFLHERAEKWQLWFEFAVVLVVISFALFCAAYSTEGFWMGLWDIIKHS